MNLRSCRRGVAALLAVPFVGASAQLVGDPVRGAQVAGVCLACHSLSPSRNLPGPSLWRVVGRRAGTAEGFGRYSAALKASGLKWDEHHLDAWLKDPSALVPGTSMSFAGIADSKARVDLIAYLEAVSAGRMASLDIHLPDLKKAPAQSRVMAIKHCGDAYRVSTDDGKTRTFWEFNLRFKTDTSTDGPASGHPVIVNNGMRGDRAAVVFSRLEEITTFIKKECP